MKMAADKIPAFGHPRARQNLEDYRSPLELPQHRSGCSGTFVDAEEFGSRLHESRNHLMYYES